MATDLFLQSEADSSGLTAGGVFQVPLVATVNVRGTGVVASDDTATANNATFITKVGGSTVGWVSPPLRAVTISSTMTMNIWASENNMNANYGASVIVWAWVASTNTFNQLTSSADGVEYNLTTRAAMNWTATPTSRTLVDGDRIVISYRNAPVGTGASGFTINMSWGGTTAAADGDSYVRFTENLEVYRVPVSNQIPQLLAQ